MVVLFSLAVGTVLDAALGRYQGKQTGETALFHDLYDNVEPGDVLLADRYYGSFWELALTRRRDADMVGRLHQRRRTGQPELPSHPSKPDHHLRGTFE